MNTLLANKKLLASLFLFLCLTIACASWYVHRVQSQYVESTKQKIEQQENTMATIANLTNSDGADSTVEIIVKDCSIENRERFDTLLGNLAQLRGQELIEVEQLFNACGDFFALRKAVMVARLEREYEVYKDFIEILSLVDSKAKLVTYDVEKWGLLVELSKKQSLMSTKLVDIQGEIIRALKQNSSVSSDELQSLLVEGQKTRDTLFEISTQIGAVR